MKKKVFGKIILLLGLCCLVLLPVKRAGAQVQKALKYAYYYDYARAEKFLLNSQDSLDNAAMLQLADALYLQGKYVQALYYYRRADAGKKITSKQSQRNYAHVSTMMQEKSPYLRKTDYFSNNYFLYTVLDTFKGNSTNEDFSTCWWGNALYVTTSRGTLANSKEFGYNFTKMPFLDVLPFNASGVRVPFPTFLPLGINTALHDGPITISKDTNTIVLTRNYTKGDAVSNHNLYLVYYLRDATRKWSEPRVVNFCNGSFSAQHPYFNNTDQYLYFSSDMSGGKGGFDLYRTKWNGSEWTPPENLGPEVNSEYDEVFPTFSPEGDMVYSTNHIETNGGLDIVIFRKGKRYLLNEPFNTAFDDFSFFFKSSDEGYFSSNRFGGRFNDEIYHFKISAPPRQTLYVKVLDADSKQELNGVKLTVSGIDGSGRMELTYPAGANTILVKDTLDARMPVKITAELSGYKFYQVSDNEFKSADNKLVKEILLHKTPVYAADNSYIVQNSRSVSKFGSVLENDLLNGVSPMPRDIILHIIGNPLTEFIQVDQEDGNVKVLANAPAGLYSMNYALCSKMSPADCDTAKIEVVVKRDLRDLLTGEVYSDGEPIVPGLQAVNDTAYVSVNGGFAINVKKNDRMNGESLGWRVSLANTRSDHPDIRINAKSGDVTVKKGIKPGTYRAYYSIYEWGKKDAMEHATVTVVVRSFDQIPGRNPGSTGKVQSSNTVVYYHNDEPSKFQLYRPAFNYLNSFQIYLKQIPLFHQRSSDSPASLDEFFNTHVAGGFDELNNSLKQIQSKLNQGVQVEVSLTAYCSPIASEEYNNKLATRRLVAMIRYIKKWNKGALADAIESNRITFWEHAVGELQAPKDVSSDYNKLDESVFGIKASRERRVSVTVKIIGMK